MTQPTNRPDPAGHPEDALAAENATLKAENAGLKELITGLQAQLAELQRRLGLDSSNSGKPPSSDGLKKPPRTSSLREPSGKPRGGQKGHPGDTLRQVETPDRVVDHYPETCAKCGATLTATMAMGHSARQVFDLPEPPPPIVTEHRAHACSCAQCGARTQAAFPEGVAAPVQYGPRISATVVYLLHGHFLPEDRLAELMRDLFGVSVVPATIARMSRCCADRFASVIDAVREGVCRANVKHLDETGFRLGGKTQWLHIASTTLLTFYRVCAQRGSLLAGVIGTAVHDHWKPYYIMGSVQHALCNAHHLRELKALVEIDQEDWARKMQILLRRACHVTNLARERGIVLKPRLIARIERRYDAILAEGLAFHQALPALRRAQRRGWKPRRIGHNLLVRLEQRRDDVLRFLHDPNVPFTNNEAERDARMMKLRQKISGGFRTQASADDFAVIRSLLSTAKKQGWNILQTLLHDPAAVTLALKVA
ncbi:MAG TPA: IS66 family transposase [Stellaceae bacterium]|jgi:transposase|nr:IS66 family transposase [Stellaceae bacterium]